MEPSRRPPDSGPLLRWLSALLRLGGELRRRKVVQAAFVYVGGGLVLLAAAETVVETYRLPDATRPVLGMLVLLGFPVAMALSWAFDWTDEGLRLADGARIPARVRRLTYGMGLVVLVAGGMAAVASAGSEPAAPVERTGPVVLGIIPFEAAAGAEWVATGLEASLEIALSDIPGISLIPARAARPYAGLPLDTLAARLGAHLLLAATIGAGGDVVDVRMYDGATRVVTSSSRVRAPPGEAAIGTLHDSLAAAVEVELRRLLHRVVKLQAWHQGTSSEASFEARNRADAALRRAEELAFVDATAFQAELGVVDSLLDVAARHDPTWVEVDLARAEARERAALGAAFNRGPAAALPILREGVSELDDVLGRHPADAGAHAARGRLRWLLHNFSLDEGGATTAALLEGAADDLEYAARADPAHASAAAKLAELALFGRGDVRLAHYWAAEAYRRDAYLQERRDVMAMLGQASLELELDGEAAVWCGRLVRAFPEAPLSHACGLEVMAWGSGPALPDSAWAAYGRIASRDRATAEMAEPYYGFAVAAVLARAGLADSARAVLDRSAAAAARSDRGAGDALWLEAAVRFRLGEGARARALLDALAQRNPEGAARARGRRALRAYLVAPTRG